jgi:hypothetical protein
VRVVTFDEAQGSQRSILMMDITASEKLGFLKSTNRIVVGISRACDGILIVRNGDGLVFRPKIVKMRKRGCRPPGSTAKTTTPGSKRESDRTWRTCAASSVAITSLIIYQYYNTPLLFNNLRPRYSSRC